MTVVISGTGGITDVNGTAAAPAITGTDTDTGVYFGTNTVGVSTNGTNALFVDASGNLGVATTTPKEKLHVNGGIIATGSYNGVANGGAVILNYSAGAGQILALDPTVAWKNLDIGSAQTTFSISGSEKARIDSSGNLLVGGTTANGFGIPSIQVGGSNGNGLISVLRNSTSSSDQIIFYNPNGLVGRIQTSASATSYVTSSDYRLKENVQPMISALEKVAALKPCTYTWKVDGSDGEGFIAHELAEVCPHAVVGEKDAVNEDGSIKPQGIDTSFLVATLTAAIQELKAEFDAYKAAHP